jgi:hypothetical protein
MTFDLTLLTMTIEGGNMCNDTHAQNEQKKSGIISPFWFFFALTSTKSSLLRWQTLIPDTTG